MAWKKGESGNPNGRPKVAEEFRAKSRKAVDEHVMQAWIDEVQISDRELRSFDGSPYTVRARGPAWVKCSELLAAYGYGKPVQPVSGPDDGPIEIVDVSKLTDAELAAIAARGAK